jgi:hypothetical protein
MVRHMYLQLAGPLVEEIEKGPSTQKLHGTNGAALRGGRIACRLACARIAPVTASEAQY